MLTLVSARHHRGKLTLPYSHDVRPNERSTAQEIISEEIIDETDRYEDNHSKRRARRQFNAKAMRGYAPHPLPLHFHHQY